MHHGTPEQVEKQFAAQGNVGQETMAESIVNYLASNPEQQVIHMLVNSTEGGLGTAASILSRNPDLKIAIISPIEVSHRIAVTISEVLSPPARFVKGEPNEGIQSTYLNADPISNAIKLSSRTAVELKSGIQLRVRALKR